MNSIITIAQVVVSIALIVLILLQERSSGSGGLFAGSGDGGFYHARRGLEKIMFNTTVVLVGLFALLSIANLLIV
ncbi:MAG: preprotein translocase subunit SecG [Patescibacteria group bacterium]